MRFLERIGSAWSALAGKAAPPAGGFSFTWGGGASFTDAFRSRRAPSPAELADAYKSIIYACANLNANAVARAPLRLYATTRSGEARPRCAVKEVSRRTGDRLRRLEYAAKAVAGAERVEEVTDHPLLESVTKVNEDLDQTQLITYTALSLDIVGSAYWWPARGKYGIPEELWALPPQLVFPVFTSGTMVPDEYRFGGVTYPKDALVRFRRLSAKNPYGQGYAPAQAAIEYARLEDAFVSMQDNLLANGPRPSVLVSPRDPKGNFGPAERQRLEADMERRGRGGRAGGVFVVDGAVAVTPISYSPTDLGGLQVSSYDLERIANCFDVPVSMLKTEDVNRANAEAGLEQHARNAVEPRCRLIASTLTRWTHSLDRKGTLGWDRLFWAFDPVVTEDKQAEADLHKTYLDLGVISRNEVRLELGYSPAEGGDPLLVPGNLTRLADAAAEADEPADADEGIAPTTESDDEDDDAPSGAGAHAIAARGLDLPVRDGTLFRILDFSRNALFRTKKPRRKPSNSTPAKTKPESKKPGKTKPGPKKPSKRKPRTTTPHGANCGIGRHGFERGNTCQSGGHGGTSGTSEHEPGTPEVPKTEQFGNTVGKKEHQYATKQEKRIARITGSTWLKDNEPADAVLRGPRGTKHGLEVKTLEKGRRHGITMHADALLRKVEYQSTGHVQVMHTIAIDHRDRFEAGIHKGRYSGHELYYKRGAGPYKLSEMIKVRDAAHLRELIHMADHELPLEARGTMPEGDALEKLRVRAAHEHEMRLKKDRRLRHRKREEELARQSQGREPGKGIFIRSFLRRLRIRSILQGARRFRRSRPLL